MTYRDIWQREANRRIATRRVHAIFETHARIIEYTVTTGGTSGSTTRHHEPNGIPACELLAEHPGGGLFNDTVGILRWQRPVIVSCTFCTSILKDWQRATQITP